MARQRKRVLVTGVAGFVGSHLAESLLTRGDDVVGIDSFTGYYEGKSSNLIGLAATEGFDLVEEDLRTVDLDALLDGVSIVYHLAGQPGVRSSWSDGFADHLELNVRVGQALLEAARRSDIRQFVYASSSSIYGNAADYPCVEGVTTPQPHSPYGVTKLAVEHLCRVYAEVFDVPTVALRYFTVYGPRQRPDMALHRLIESGLGGPTFPKFGDGSQLRDFTFVDDVVAATVAAGEADLAPGEVINVAGGSQATLDRLIELVSDHLGPLAIDERSPEPGDVRATGGSIERAATLLNWRPATSLEVGVARQVEWHRSRRDETG